MNLDHLTTQEQLEVLNRLIGAALWQSRNGKAADRAKARWTLQQIEECVKIVEKRKSHEPL